MGIFMLMVGGMILIFAIGVVAERADEGRELKELLAALKGLFTAFANLPSPYEDLTKPFSKRIQTLVHWGNKRG